jgi:hypothetical protein
MTQYFYKGLLIFFYFYPRTLGFLLVFEIICIKYAVIVFRYMTFVHCPLLPKTIIIYSYRNSTFRPVKTVPFLPQLGGTDSYSYNPIL